MSSLAITLAVLAIVVALVYLVIALYLVPRIDLAATDRRIVLLVRVGAGAFFLGCAATHAHMAIHYLSDPASANVHQLLFHIPQAVGGWLFVIVSGRHLDIAVIRKKSASERRVEQELADSRRARRDSLGDLAGGVAHDFNNLLVGVIGNAELLASRVTGPDQRELVEQITLAGTQAAALTQQMLAYSGRGKFVVENLSVSVIAQEMAELLASAISKNATLVMDCPDDAPSIRADATQIRQIVMNLLTNASEALDGHAGTIELAVDGIDATEGFLEDFTRSQPLTPGSYVRLTVTDTGRGMDEVTMRRIFDPYFSTKFTGRGLGLASVLGIIEGHRGGVRIESFPQVGTTFTVILPAISEPADPVTASAPVMVAPDALLVLVADDEPLVRSVMALMLENGGHTVVEATDGNEAIRLFEADPDRFDLAIIDLVMPGLGGDEVCARIREQTAVLPVLIASGFNAGVVSTRFAASESAGFLQKPFTYQELTAAIAGMLAGGAGEAGRDESDARGRVMVPLS